MGIVKALALNGTRAIAKEDVLGVMKLRCCGRQKDQNLLFERKTVVEKVAIFKYHEKTILRRCLSRLSQQYRDTLKKGLIPGNTIHSPEAVQDRCNSYRSVHVHKPGQG